MLIAVAAILTACGAVATSADNAADASQGSRRGKQARPDPNAGIQNARDMASWDEGGAPGCFDPSLSGRQRAVAERLGAIPCSGSETSQGAAALARGGDNWSGHYTGGGEFAGGDLNIRRADATRYSVAFEIGGEGCGGGIDGIGHAAANRMTMIVPVQSGYQQCRLVLDRQGSTLRVSQSGDCYLFYGGQCSFDGTYARERSASAAPAPRTVSAAPVRPAAQSASWIIGAWSTDRRHCDFVADLTFRDNGTFYTDGEEGDWRLSGNNLTLVTRATVVEGDTVPLRTPRATMFQVNATGRRALVIRSSNGRPTNMQRC